MARCFQEYFSKVVTTEFHFTTKGCLQCPFRDSGSASKCSHSHRRAVPALQPVISTSGFFTCALRAANRTAGAIVDLHGQRISARPVSGRLHCNRGLKLDADCCRYRPEWASARLQWHPFRGKNAVGGRHMADSVYGIVTSAVVMSDSWLRDFLHYLFCDMTRRICQVGREVKEKEK